MEHTKYTFQVVHHVPIPENRHIDYISSNSPNNYAYKIIKTIMHTKYTFTSQFILVSTTQAFGI